MTNQLQPSDPLQEKRSTWLLMTFALVSSLVVLVVIGFLVYGLLNNISSASVAGRSTSGIPYGIDKRRLPPSENLGQVFPAKLGAFQRQSLFGGADEFTAVYLRDNGDQIRVNGSAAVSSNAAQFEVHQVRNASGPSRDGERILDSDPSFSYYLNVRSEETQFAYSHSRWFFDIRASSKAALDEFMKVFEY